eukprot:CAMPEP_0181233050 /NCGR_PEP_ID=MMETSP1096-20121128/36110_1 /TAXON_ID=156174 ORGANISM="Chrysochromulina ericina, Strain CCMP281" /NCGR_SAMPLE_ID=MMETSP1096 /ASSEMBLY_ACC=CAM_ASM_000453 /LENGTH=69 /DNA_ID=CAMNT_0023327487 /DNA_START=356 /DNA_END=565 /DNA_ORIENTATION=+
MTAELTPTQRHAQPPPADHRMRGGKCQRHFLMPPHPHQVAAAASPHFRPPARLTRCLAVRDPHHPPQPL